MEDIFTESRDRRNHLSEKGMQNRKDTISDRIGRESTDPNKQIKLKFSRYLKVYHNLTEPRNREVKIKRLT